MPTPAIQFTIESCLGNVPLVGTAVNQIMIHLGCEALEAYHVELCVVEALTNAIRHAYGNLPGHEVAVKLTIEDQRVVLHVSNGGLPLPRARLENTGLVYDPRDIDNLPCGGMGLYLLRTLMDDLRGYEEDGLNHLVMVKRLKTATAAAHRPRLAATAS